jgi:hypothetical protein
MHRITGDGYIVDGGKHRFADEDLPTRNATQVTHQFMNAVQEEISAIIEAEGGTLHTDSETYAQMNQLKTAINAKVAAYTSNAIAAALVSINNTLSNWNTPHTISYQVTEGLTTIPSAGAWWSQIGKVVFLTLAGVGGISNSTGLVITLSEILPDPCQLNMLLPAMISDNNLATTGVAGFGVVHSDKKISFGISDKDAYYYGKFTPSGNKYIWPQSFSYICQ